MNWNILGSSKISVRYQVTLPEDVRKRLDVKEGEQLLFSEEDGKIVLRNSRLDS
jgi:AbrB family looped-hinge helix DNA binding protein